MTTDTLTSAFALPASNTGAFPLTDLVRSIVQGITNWKARCEAVEHLNGLNEHLLNDIGIARCDIEHAVVSGMRSKA